MEIDAKPSEESKEARRNLVVHAVHYPFEKMADVLVRLKVDPGHITASKIPLTIAALAVHQATPVEGAVAFLLASVPDILDGKVARKSGKVTLEGAVLDALVDKIVNAYVYLYLLVQMDWQHMAPDVLLAVLMMLNAAFDVVSQRQRGGLIGQIRTSVHIVLNPGAATPGVNSQQANMAGKVKAHLQCYGIVAALVGAAYPSLSTLAVPFLSLSLVFSFKSIRGRSRQ
ncbi:MAG: CDP-alcohol phosphatidyltransferase family protein [Candidatus Altimarinota bacterium]